VGLTLVPMTVRRRDLDEMHEPDLVSIPGGSDGSSGRNPGHQGASTAGLQGGQELKPALSG